MYLEELFGLSGKTAIVTGAGRGIGQVIACGLAKAGAEIVSISRSGAAETVEMITKEGGKAYDLNALRKYLKVIVWFQLITIVLIVLRILGLL